MLTALELDNFKAFGERTRIEFAPITLIFGENSAGKSSILQALSLLKQTRQSREQGSVLVPRTEGGFVDLGSYQELLFDHDLSRELCFRLDMELNPDIFPERSASLLAAICGIEPSGLTDPPPENRTRELPEKPAVVGFEVCFSRPSLREDVQLKSVALLAPATVGKLAVFEPTGKMHSAGTGSRRHQISQNDAAARGFQVARCTWHTADRKFWSDWYALARKDAGRWSAELRGGVGREPPDYQAAYQFLRIGFFV